MDYGDKVFDIGANVGARTQLFLDTGVREVVAVEPVSACFAALEARFVGNVRVTPVHKAVGAEVGRSRILLCSPNDDPLCACSSMSPAWVEAVQHAHRFWPNNPEYRDYVEKLWKKEEEVDVTTLDELIAKYGKPSFIKIDVEGYELEVLKGLSQRVPGLAFEFVPEYLDAAIGCIDRCSELGFSKFSAAIKEETQPSVPWITAANIKDYVSQFRGNNVIYGDVYAIS